MHHKQTEQIGAFYWYEYPGVGNIPIAEIPGNAKIADQPALLQAPDIGEHTAMVLGELGYDKASITELASSGAINTQLATQVAD